MFKKLIFIIVVILLYYYFSKSKTRQQLLFVKQSSIAGRGVFTNKNIDKNEIIEVCPTISFNLDSIKDDSELNNYYFNGQKEGEGVILLGYGSIYNHSDSPNADYYLDPNNQGNLLIVSNQYIKKGEEITISYSEDWWQSR